MIRLDLLTPGDVLSSSLIFLMSPSPPPSLSLTLLTEEVYPTSLCGGPSCIIQLQVHCTTEDVPRTCTHTWTRTCRTHRYKHTELSAYTGKSILPCQCDSVIPLQELNRLALLFRSEPQMMLWWCSRLGTGLNKEDSPRAWYSVLPSSSKVALHSHLESLVSIFLRSLRSAYWRQNGCSCARTHPQESLSDVSDWDPRPISGQRCGCGERREGSVYGVISFRKMRHLYRPSHCGSLLLSFLVIINADRHPSPPTSPPFQHTYIFSVRPRGLVEWGDIVGRWAGLGGVELRDGAVRGAETHLDDSWGDVLQRRCNLWETDTSSETCPPNECMQDDFAQNIRLYKNILNIIGFLSYY